MGSLGLSFELGEIEKWGVGKCRGDEEGGRVGGLRNLGCFHTLVVVWLQASLV
jgi:hypothetical protein